MNAQGSKKGPGMWLRTTRLLAQARFTIDLVKVDPKVSKLAGKFLTTFEGLTHELQEQLAVVTRSRLAAKSCTQVESLAATEALDWIRGFRRYHRTARVHGIVLPTMAPTAPRVTANRAQLAATVVGLVKHGQERVSELAAFGITPEFLAEGEHMAAALTDADRRQEVARGVELANQMQVLRELKSKVYGGVTQLVAHGRTAHTDNPAKAAQYNLRIMYRGLPGPTASVNATESPPAATG